MGKVGRRSARSGWVAATHWPPRFIARTVRKHMASAYRKRWASPRRGRGTPASSSILVTADSRGIQVAVKLLPRSNSRSRSSRSRSRSRHNNDHTNRSEYHWETIPSSTTAARILPRGRKTRQVAAACNAAACLLPLGRSSSRPIATEHEDGTKRARRYETRRGTLGFRPRGFRGVQSTAEAKAHWRTHARTHARTHVGERKRAGGPAMRTWCTQQVIIRWYAPHTLGDTRARRRDAHATTNKSELRHEWTGRWRAAPFLPNVGQLPSVSLPPLYSPATLLSFRAIRDPLFALACSFRSRCQPVESQSLDIFRVIADP